MAYTALYRKYRPTTFEEMAGQKHIVKTLENAVNQNKIAHAYLFCGPRGTGKTSSAKIFAKAINCEGDNRPCNECENCKLALEGNHPDIIEIDAASNNGVEEVRNLIEKVKYAPLKGKYKIYIIDEVHMMSKSAYNALLKTIEEPPKHVIFIFATTEPYKVLPTIISRCQRYDFNKINNSDIKDYLNKICLKENIQFEEGVLEAIAILADGGMRDALSILDQCYAYAPEKIMIKDVYDIYGVVTTNEKLEILSYINSNNTIELMKKLNSLDQKGIDIKRFTSDLIEILKEKVIFDYTNDTSSLSILNFEQVGELIKNNSAKESLDMIDILMDSFEKYRTATNLMSYLEIALLKMIDIVSRETITPQLNKPVVEEQKVVSQPQEEVKIEKELEIKEENEEYVDEETEVEEVAQEDTSIIISSDIDEVEEISETIDEVISNENKYNYKTLEDSYVLGLLVGANKEEKLADQQQYTTMRNYELDLDYAKQVTLLKGTQIIASGTNYIIVVCDTQSIANEINELDKTNEFKNLFNLVLKKNKKVFAISQLQCDRVIEEFKERYKSGMLPPAINIEIEEVKEEKKDETVDTLNILFGNNFEVKED